MPLVAIILPCQTKLAVHLRYCTQICKWWRSPVLDSNLEVSRHYRRFARGFALPVELVFTLSVNGHECTAHAQAGHVLFAALLVVSVSWIIAVCSTFPCVSVFFFVSCIGPCRFWHRRHSNIRVLLFNQRITAAFGLSLLLRHQFF